VTARRILIAIAALASAGLMPAAGWAAGGVDLRFNEATKWPDRELVLSLPAKRVLDATQVTVLENDSRVLGAKVTSQSTNRKRGVVLAIDASLTMRGEPIRQAMVAARSFAKRRPDSTAVGVIFFSRTPRVALAPTTNARRIGATLAVGPQVTRGTKIYDAASAGIAALKAAGLTSGAIVVLSDGAEAENGSATTPAALATLARHSNVRIFSVGLSSASFDPTSLRLMASSTGGRYGQAERPQDLPPLFAAIGERLSSEYVVSYRSLAPAGQPVQVRAHINGFADTSGLSYQAPSLVTGAISPVGGVQDSNGLSPGRIVALAAGFFLAMMLVLYLVLHPKRRSIVSRVSEFASDTRLEAPTLATVRRRRERRPSDRWRRYADAVELSGVKASPAGLLLWTAVGTVLVACYFGLLVGRPVLIVLALGVPLIARLVVLSRLKKRRLAFEEQLPDNLQVLASALRAGYSFSAAMASMAEDAPEPSRTELRRASADEQLGTDVAEALEAVGERMANPEIEYVGIVARMQREAGGNTAEVLDQVIETIRARQQLVRMVRVLTAQGRMSGGVISAMPIVVVIGMALQNPGYFDPMFDSTLGVTLIVAGIVMLASGWLIIRKVVDIKP
jgi:tight adherence protein B